VSFGLPHRETINGAFLTMAMASGLTSAITNPLLGEVKGAIMAGDVLLGHDQDCARWIRTFREPPAEGDVVRRRTGRRGPAGRGVGIDQPRLGIEAAAQLAAIENLDTGEAP
jgi:5-methyltetrahydrofolate--homocysteine methyltransferase